MLKAWFGIIYYKVYIELENDSKYTPTLDTIELKYENFNLVFDLCILQRKREIGLNHPYRYL